MMTLEPLVQLRRDVGAINVPWISFKWYGEDGFKTFLRVNRPFRPGEACSSLIVCQNLHVAS